MRSYEKSLEHSWSNKYIFPFYLSSTKKDNFLVFSMVFLVFKSNMEILLRVMETKNIASITIIRIFKYINIYQYIYVYIYIYIYIYQQISININLYCCNATIIKFTNSDFSCNLKFLHFVHNTSLLQEWEYCNKKLDCKNANLSR